MRRGAAGGALYRCFLVGDPSGDFFVGEEVGAGLVVGVEEVGIRFVGEALAVEENSGAVAGGADEAAEGLVDALHGGDLVNRVEGFVAGELAEFSHAGVLEGVDFGEGRADDHGVGDAAAEEIDAFGVAAAEDQEEGVGEDEVFFHEGGLLREFESAFLDRDADGREIFFHAAADFFGVAVGGEEDGDGGGRVGREFVDGRGGGGEMFSAGAEAGVDADVDGDFAGSGAPGGVGGEGGEFVFFESAGAGEFRVRAEGGGHHNDLAEFAEGFGDEGGGGEAAAEEFAAFR